MPTRRAMNRLTCCANTSHSQAGVGAEVEIRLLAALSSDVRMAVPRL